MKEAKRKSPAETSRTGTRAKVLYYILKRKDGIVKKWDMNSGADPEALP